jgi:hypothetical protein
MRELVARFTLHYPLRHHAGKFSFKRSEALVGQ